MNSNLKRLAKKHLPSALVIVKGGASLAKHQISRRKIRRLISAQADLCVEVGAGNKKGRNGWTTIDVRSKCDIFWDLRKGLPFPDASLKKIYSSHFLEHLSFKEINQFLVECRRALIPGGVFSICVPNAKVWLEAYVYGKTLSVDEFLAYPPAYNQTTSIDYVNYVAYMDGEHKYMFDEDNLLYVLRTGGFKNVHLRQMDADLDLPERDIGSIYAEAEK